MFKAADLKAEIKNQKKLNTTKTRQIFHIFGEKMTAFKFSAGNVAF